MQKRISIYLSDSLYNEIEKRAKTKEVTVSQTVTELLIRGLSLSGKKVSEEDGQKYLQVKEIWEELKTLHVCGHTCSIENAARVYFRRTCSNYSPSRKEVKNLAQRVRAFLNNKNPHLS